MFRKRLLLFSLSIAVAFLQAQELNDQNFRTYSGVNNNPVQLNWGTANSNLRIITDIGFADGYEAPGGENRPNPRTVSNTLFDQADLLNDPMGLSDFCWVWGQFIDHDIGLTSDGPEFTAIQVPAGDPHFDPFGLGQAIIPMHRNTFMPLTGTNVGNPRRYPNEITAFIDGSAVYGSDETRALWIRSLEDGKLRTSAGNFLPFNTLDGNFYDEIDPTAPFMANGTGISDKIFVAGDVRASENSLLLSFHILFLREHNRQCDLLKALHPDWTDEQLYQYARKIVGGIIQSIMYEEWLPAVGIDLPAYEGYDASVDPQLSNVFTAAAYRVGHTLLSSTLQRLDHNGDVIPEGNLTLQEAFFNPFTILEIGAIDPYLKGMAVQTQQEMDAKVVSDIRNFLFGQPGFGGLDLASININRGRERGLTDYNTIRENIGLSRYNFFQQINSNSSVFTRLQSLYLDIDDVDPWVGMLAETPLQGSIFGPSLHTILKDQFLNLRDGDRFYYWNDPVLTQDEKEYIQNITLRDVIMYNTDITLMQDNVFGALPHEEICQNMTMDVSGLIRKETGEAVPNVTLNLAAGVSLETFTTSADGEYLFSDASFCDVDFLIPERTDGLTNGVSTFDIILIQKHILAIELLDSPYKMIAADVNNSGNVSTLDLIRLRKAILGIDTEFVGNTSWRFILASFQFPEDVDPLTVTFPEFIDFSDEDVENLNAGFIAVKIGDVNNTANAFDTPANVDLRDMAAESTTRHNGLTISYPRMTLQAGKVYTLPIQLIANENLQGLQFELQFEGFTLLDLETEIEDAFYSNSATNLRLSWNTSSVNQSFGQKVMNLRFIANRDGQLGEMLHLSRSFVSEAYHFDNDLMRIILKEIDSHDVLIVEQNQPNPFNANTTIAFYLPLDDIVCLSIRNLSGQTIFQVYSEYEKGWHDIKLNREILPIAGFYQYEFKTSTSIESKSLIVH